MDRRLLDLLVCPLCKGPLDHRAAAGELVCPADRLAFPVRDGIPVMLEGEARALSGEGDGGGGGGGGGGGAVSAMPAPAGAPQA